MIRTPVLAPVTARRADRRYAGHVRRLAFASLACVLNELVQNARRAGSSIVSVESSRHPTRPGTALLVVSDEGAGIAEPRFVLDHGTPHWPPSILAAEAPSGLGLATLGAAQAEIHSWPLRERPGWKMKLDRGILAGERPGQPLALPPNSARARTVVSLQLAATPAAVARALDGITDRPTINVEIYDHVTRAPDTAKWRTPGASPVGAADFVLHRGGIAFGVFSSAGGRRDPQPSVLEVHGTRTGAGLPEETDPDGTRHWVHAWAYGCPSLAVDPDDRAAVAPTPHLDTVREHAREALAAARANARRHDTREHAR